jgi:hypothetical protein
MNDEAAILSILANVADRLYDGHLTIMRFTTNWRVHVGYQPDNRQDIQNMSAGASMASAAMRELARIACETDSKPDSGHPAEPAHIEETGTR